MSTQEITDSHRGHIGASEAAQAVNLSRFGDAYKLWARKSGLLPREPETTEGPLYWGSRLEPLVAEEYERRHNVGLIKSPCGYFSAVYPSLVAHPDYEHPGAGPLVECKTWDQRSDFGPAGSDDVPNEIAIQCQIQMLLARREVVHVPVLFQRSSYTEFIVPFHRPLAESVAQACEALMDRVRRNDPPPADWGREWTREIHQLLHPPRPGSHKTLSESAGKDAELYVSIGRQMAALKEKRDRALGRILEEAGDCQRATMPNGYRLTRWAQLDGPRYRVLEPLHGQRQAPYALPELGEAESLEQWLELGGAEIDAAIAAIGAN